jgi:acetyl esterase
MLEVPLLDLSAAARVGGALHELAERYLPDQALARNPRASPMHAPDLSGLPPACIFVAEHDRLRPQGEAYGRRLAAAGVPVTLEIGYGATHESLILTRVWPPAAAWQRRSASILSTAHHDDPAEERP